ncbi:MAG: DNA polymerase IV [Spirochaetota bacterium]
MKLSRQVLNRDFDMAVFFHVDLDAFYASVEQLDHPELKGKAVIIGARPGSRGVVSACSYEARKYGIRSAMPISQAYRKCPSGIFLPPRMERYAQISKGVMKIFDSYSPKVQQISIDEAFVDMSGTEKLFGPPYEAAARLKKQVLKETGLTLSIGIAPNRFLAKMASDFSKPDGLCQVKEGEEIDFIDKLDLKHLWGVGGKSIERLKELNIETVQTLRQFSEGLLKTMFGQAGGTYLYKAVRGIDPGIFSEEPKSHSISNEVTFEEDIMDSDGIKKVLLELSHQVMFRMMQEQCQTKTVFLKVRFFDFTTTTAQATLQHFVNSAEELYRMSTELLDKRWDHRTPIRLIGVGVSSLKNDGSCEQQELFEDEFGKKKKVEQAVFKIRHKLSGNSVIKASLLNRKRTRHKE